MGIMEYFAFHVVKELELDLAIQRRVATVVTSGLWTGVKCEVLGAGKCQRVKCGGELRGVAPQFTRTAARLRSERLR